jgi:hypothetical protein
MTARLSDPPFEPSAKTLNLRIREQPPHNDIAEFLVLLHLLGSKKRIGRVGSAMSRLDVTRKSIKPAGVRRKKPSLHFKFKLTNAPAKRQNKPCSSVQARRELLMTAVMSADEERVPDAMRDGTSLSSLGDALLAIDRMRVQRAAVFCCFCITSTAVSVYP